MNQIIDNIKMEKGALQNSSQNLFIKSVFYAFGLRDNPVAQILNEKRHITDLDNIKSDWVKVGTDIRKVYEQETANIR